MILVSLIVFKKERERGKISAKPWMSRLSFFWALEEEDEDEEEVALASCSLLRMSMKTFVVMIERSLLVSMALL